jgi:hypothetical protein
LFFSLSPSLSLLSLPYLSSAYYRNTPRTIGIHPEPIIIGIHPELDISDQEIKTISSLATLLLPVKKSVEALCSRKRKLFEADAILLYMLNKVQKESNSTSNNATTSNNAIPQPQWHLDLLENLAHRVKQRRGPIYTANAVLCVQPYDFAIEKKLHELTETSRFSKINTHQILVELIKKWPSASASAPTPTAPVGPVEEVPVPPVPDKDADRVREELESVIKNARNQMKKKKDKDAPQLDLDTGTNWMVGDMLDLSCRKL